MKRRLVLLLVFALLCTLLPMPGHGELQAIPDDVRTWMDAFEHSYLGSDSTALKPIVPVAGWNVYVGGDWTYQYPPDWSVLSGDAYSFLACDARQVACYDYVQVQSFTQALSHDGVGAYAFSRIAGNLPFQVVGTFSKNILPQLMLSPPNGISQVWYIRWQHPTAGQMFTMLQVVLLSYFDSAYGGNSSASWSSWTAPEAEFAAMAEAVFTPMYYSSTYTLPGGGEDDRDQDGYPDSNDVYPDDPQLH